MTKEEKLAGLLICLAGFSVVIANISNGYDKLSLERLGIWYVAILISATVISAVCYVKEKKQSLATWAAENWFIVIYILLRIVSGIVNGSIANTSFLLTVSSEAYLLYGINSTAVKEISVRFILCMITAFDLIAVSLCLYHYMFLNAQTQDALNAYAQGTVAMPFSLVFHNPNSAGLLAGLAVVILSTVLLKGYQNSAKTLLIPLIVINIIFVLWTGCRSAIAGVLVFCAVLILNGYTCLKGYKRWLSIVVVCCIAMLIPVYVVAFVSDSQNGLANTDQELQIDTVSSGRYNIWKQHIISQKGHYILGFSTIKDAINARAENFCKLMEDGVSAESEQLSAAADTSLGPHNGYLELMLVSGLPGFLLILLFLYKRIGDMDNNFIKSHPEILCLIYLFVICTQESRFITSGLNCITLTMMLLLNFRPDDNCCPAETSREDHPLCRGVTESDVYVTNDDGKNVRTHILRISKSAEVNIKAVCGVPDSQNRGHLGFSKLSQLVSMHDDERNIIAASNGDFFDINGEPSGIMVSEGQIIKDSGNEPFFAVLDTGRCVIRKAGGKTKDIKEAIGGDRILVKKGEIIANDITASHPRQAVGVCSDGTVVIVNAEGRQPDSSGLSIYELAELMKAQGCVSALNLDGGGSAGFMTKRSGDEAPVFRNTPADGFERNVSSALLIVNTNGEKHSGRQTSANKAANMLNNSTRLERTLFGKYKYCINGESASGIFTINGKSFLFDKGNGVSRSINIGETSYTFKNGIYSGSSDPEAGDVLMGYCGSKAFGGKNLIYALQKGNFTLKIGLASMAVKNKDTGADIGEMDNWMKTQEECLPWYAFRHCIKKVYIADGVTTVGSRFLSMPKGVVKGGTKTPVNELQEIRLPNSLKEIGAYAFYNKPLLKSVMLPSADIVIGKRAFDDDVGISVKD